MAGRAGYVAPDCDRKTTASAAKAARTTVTAIPVFAVVVLAQSGRAVPALSAFRACARAEAGDSGGTPLPPWLAAVLRLLEGADLGDQIFDLGVG